MSPILVVNGFKSFFVSNPCSCRMIYWKILMRVPLSSVLSNYWRHWNDSTWEHCYWLLLNNRKLYAKYFIIKWWFILSGVFFTLSHFKANGISWTTGIVYKKGFLKNITTGIAYKKGLQKNHHDRDCILMVRTVLKIFVQY